MNLKEKKIESYTLIEIELLLRLYDKSLCDYPNMPVLGTTILGRLSNSMIIEESSYDIEKLKEEHLTQYILLTEERCIYDVVTGSVEKKEGGFLFLYGPGDTGKTFVYNTIINCLRSEGWTIIPVASSGIAALLLSGGRKAHSRFKIPLKTLGDDVCEIKSGSMLADLLIKTDLIIWDEAPMTHKYAFKALDRSLRDIMFCTDPDSYTKPFGGKTVILGDDFRQTLPIIPQGSRQDSVSAAINRSYLWNYCQIINLLF